MNQESKNAGGVSIGIPAVVVGVLIALKHIGMTNLSYGDIIWFGIQVWVVCLAVIFAIWLLTMAIGIIFGSIK